MLTKDTRGLLKNLLLINNKMILNSVSYGTDEFKTIYYKAELNKIPNETIKEEFGIFDTGSFLSALDLLDDPKIELNGNEINASDDNTSLTFLTSHVSTLEEIEVDPKLFTGSESATSILEFDLSSDTLSQIKKSGAVFKTFDTLYINNKRTTTLDLGAHNSLSRSNNQFSIKVDTSLNTGQDFKLPLLLDSILKVPQMDYKVMVKYNEDAGQYRVILKNELLTFIISLMQD